MGRVALLHQNHHTPSMKSRHHRFKSNQNPSKTPVSVFPLPNNRKQTPLQENRMPKKTDTAEAAVAAKPAAFTVSKNLSVGQVKILKRGETLEECSTKAENDRKMLSSSYAKIEASKPEEPAANRFGSDPEMVSRQKTKQKHVAECFAGFVFFDSPPPSSVPLPGFSFSKKKLVSNVNNDACSKL